MRAETRLSKTTLVKSALGVYAPARAKCFSVKTLRMPQHLRMTRAIQINTLFPG
jgi:hypothetical protein